MLRRVAYLTAVAGVGLTLAGCALNFLGFERRAAWRDHEERACMASRAVPVSASIARVGRVRDRGACGIALPLKISAFQAGHVGLGPAATLNCPMTAAVEAWMTYAVQPAALAWLGTTVVEIKQISAYACRPINSIPGEDLSEHAFGNAIDVAGFKLADGRSIVVKDDWNGGRYERAFLREVFAAACERFKTTLGPGYKYHGDHFHLDLAHHNADGRSQYCNPKPEGPATKRAPYAGAPIVALSPVWPDSRWPQVVDPRSTALIPAYAAE